MHASAFEGLGLVVELDFSWNKLVALPLNATRHLRLLRKLSMRGNLLQAINDSTLGIAALYTAASSHRLAADHRELPEESQAGGLFGIFSALAREPPAARAGDAERRLTARLLFEAFPDVARALAASSSSSSSSSTNNKERADTSDAAFAELLAREISEIDERAAITDNRLYGELVEAPLDANEAAVVANSLHGALEGAFPRALGAYFPELQELDFGQCKLRYIAPESFEGLDKLKKLQLDGNELR